MALNGSIELGIMKFWEREDSVTFLLQNQKTLHEIISD